jgi:hypothetical protein
MRCESRFASQLETESNDVAREEERPFPDVVRFGHAGGTIKSWATLLPSTFLLPFR